MNINIDVTVFIRTKINNKIKLDGFPLINPSLDKCRRINNNVFSLNDDLVLKEIKSKKLNRPSDESMREILPFYDMEPHDCIIKLKGYAYIFDNLYLVLEKGDESLEEHIRKRDLNNEMIMKIIVCVCCGLIHMHKHSYIHRDIKPANIVVSKNGEAKLIDFGISRPYIQDDLTKEIGTYGYYAPEVIEGRYDFRADIYSLGVVILNMISDIKLCDFINGADLINVPRTTQVIIRSMLSQDLSNRPMLDEILVLIFKKIFFLVQDMNEFTDEIGERYFTLTKISREVKFSFPDNFKNREKEDFKSLNQLYRKNYSFTKVRNDFYFLMYEDDKFIFHYAMNCFLNEKLDSASLFYLGNLLKDNYCSYMIDSMMILEYHIAFDAQKVNPDMRQSFLSLESDNIKNYLIIFPQKLDDKNCSRSTKDLIQDASGSYTIAESKLSDKLLNSFIYFDINLLCL